MRIPALAFAALACQALGIVAVGPETSDLLHRALIDAGSLIALVFVAFNWRLAPVRLLALGLVLNLAVMAANGGLMPVTPSNAVRAGFHQQVASLEIGDAVPHSKDVLLLRRDTWLAPISDNIVLPDAVPGRGVFSPGDLVIAAALLYAAASVVVAAVRRVVVPRAKRGSAPPRRGAAEVQS